METKLTKTQLFMIEQIKLAIKKEKENYKKANDSEKFKVKLKLKNLEEQLKRAQQPFERTEKEKELINKIANNVKENAEIMKGKKIEGDRSDRPLTSKEEFEHGISMFIEEVGNRKTQLEKDIATQKGILEILENHEFVGDEASYKAEIAGRKNIVAQMEMSLELFNERLSENEEVTKWALENYDNISKLNKFLNNPLKLKDYEDYVIEKRKRFNV